MKTKRSHAFRKITRIFYLLGVVFLLAGMFLSVVNMPAQAGSAPGSAYQATRLPPGSVVKPPSVQPPVVKPPVAPPVVPPASNPGTPPQGPGAQGVNRGPSAMATPIMRSGPSAMAVQVPGASVHFTQADYCYDGPAGLLTATVEVSLPEGMQARLQTDWYVVRPRDTVDPVHHYDNDTIVEDGDVVQFEGQWPGIGSWVPGQTVEIHFGANLLDINDFGPISDADGLDVFYNGGCNPRPPVVLSPTCQEDGILWTLSNPSAASVPFTYTVNGQPGGSGTIPPSGSTTFTTVGGGTTVVVTYDNGLGGTATVTSTAPENCGVVQQPLTLSHACTANGVTWTVTNPNPSGVNFTWNLDSGAQTGNGSVAANSSITVTSAADTTVAHSLAVTSSLGTVTNSSTANECTQEEAELTVLHACLDATNTIQWQVRNDSTVDTNFSWSLDGGPSTNSFVAAGQTVNVTTSPSGAHSLVVTWSTGTATGTSAAGFCGVVPPSITLRHACDTQTNGILWYATNTGANTTLVEWSLDGTTTGNVSISAGQEVLLTTSTTGAHTMQVTFGNNIVVTDSSEAGECGTTILLPLTISYACVVGQSSLEWTVTNPNATAVTFRWALDGGVLSAPFVVSANGTLMFHTSNSTAVHTMRVTWVNPSGAPDGEVQLSSPAGACGTVTPTPPPSLNLAYACIDVNNIQWTAVNPGPDPVDFTWVRDTNAENGSGTAPAGGQVNFLVTNSNAHTVSITWVTETGPLTVTRTSPADVCDVVVTDTPTPTPTATFTNTPTPTTTATFTNTPTATATSIITATDTPTPTPTTEIIITNTPTVTNTPGTGPSSTPVTSFTSTPGTGPSNTPVTSFTNTPGIPVTGGTATQVGGTTVVGTTVAGTTVAGTVVVGLAQGTSTPGPTSTPIAQVGVPITGSGADQQSLAGAYGADMSHPTGAALWQQILLNGGLLFFGLALIFEGLGRKFR